MHLIDCKAMDDHDDENVPINQPQIVLLTQSSRQSFAQW
jgi:hypothetical protein